jgi:hypothetical protein
LTVLNRFRTIVKEDIVKDFFISLKIWKQRSFFFLRKQVVPL